MDLVVVQRHLHLHLHLQQTSWGQWGNTVSAVFSQSCAQPHIASVLEVANERRAAVLAGTGVQQRPPGRELAGCGIVEDPTACLSTAAAERCGAPPCSGYCRAETPNPLSKGNASVAAKLTYYDEGARGERAQASSRTPTPVPAHHA